MFYYLFMFLKYNVKIYNVKIVPSQRKCCFSSEQVVFSGVPIEEAWARSKVRQVLAPSRCQQARVSLVSSMALLLRAERDPSMATPGIPPTECPFAPTLISLSIRRLLCDNTKGVWVMASLCSLKCLSRECQTSVSRASWGLWRWRRRLLGRVR